MRNLRIVAASLSATAILTLCFGTQGAQAGEFSRLATYQRGGETFYALSLMPDLPDQETDASAVVVLFDTSASQQGAYRDSALAALDALLANLRPNDRVELLAVDLDVKPLTTQFVAPGSAALRAATAQLRQQVPLGSTDLAGALRAATARLVQAGAEQRTVVYIGDGISLANLLDAATLAPLVSELRDARVSVTSYAIGPKIDARLLAVLANHTGGNLRVPQPLVWRDEAAGISDQRAQQENVRRAEVAGKLLAQWTRALVLWPQQVDLATELGQTFPSVTPPLRSDRDTILLGQTADRLSQAMDVKVVAQGPAGPVELSWKVEAEPSSEDHAFLAEMVDAAKRDEGLSLPTVGSAGLAEAARQMGVQLDQLTQLAEQAVATGDRQAAGRIAQAVMRADPGNVQAKTVQQVVSKESTAAKETVLAQPRSVAPSVQADQALLDQVAGDGKFLDQVEQERRVYAEMLSKEIQNTIVDARSRMTSDPKLAMQDLKLALESVQRAPDLEAAKRAELLDKLRTALKEARRQASLKAELDRQREEELASIRERKLLNDRLTKRLEREKQLMDRFSALMDENHYKQAADVAQIVEELEPNRVTPRAATREAQLMGHHYLQQVAREARHKATFDTMYQIELSHIPFPDNPPIVYPDAAVWEELTNRRQKYKSVDLSARSKAEERIQSALREPLKTPIEAVETPLNELLNQLQSDYDIPIVFDNAALDEVAVSTETEVTINLRNISLRSALNLMLKQPGLEDLTYIVDEEVLLITTEDKANETLKVKVYPVADLVLPVQNLGIIGGSGGGGLGGGGGVGGGGGGGFGGGGGGGGGFFNVADDVAAEGKPQQQVPSNPTSPTLANGSSSSTAKSSESAAGQDDADVAKTLEIDASVSPEEFWSHRFQQQRLDPAVVRQTVRDLMKQGRTDQVIALIQAALRHGQPQSWMYESLGIAMELEGRAKSEIERAIMSACDFSSSPDELVLIAQYLSRIDLDRRAVDVYRQVVKLAPLHYEAYALGLRAAQRAEDLAGIRWATVGILQQAWPREQQEIRRTAQRVAQATLEDLKRSGDEATYHEYRRQLEQAMIRDCVVKVTWSGDADVDLIVEEPGGTVCSLSEPRTTGGGVSLGDSYASEEHQNPEGLSEQYVVARGFAGTYRVHIRKVWGKVVADKVTVDVTTNVGTDTQRHERQRIKVYENQDAVVVFELEQGRRTEPLAAEQLAVAVKRQAAVSRAVLAQQIGSISDPSIAPIRSNGLGLRRRLALAGRGGAVGFQPIIITLPEGTQMIATGVVSADRRYVRISASPSFTGIGDVTSFTFAGSAAQTGSGTGGGGAGGGAIGGAGGGGAGAGGGIF